MRKKKQVSREIFIFLIYDSVREEIIAVCFTFAKALFFSSSQQKSKEKCLNEFHPVIVEKADCSFFFYTPAYRYIIGTVIFMGVLEFDL